MSNEDKNYYENLLKEIEDQKKRLTDSFLVELETKKDKKENLSNVSIFPSSKRSESVDKQLENRNKELKNKELEQKIDLKRKTLFILFIFLATETLIIFIFSFFQAISNPLKFKLEEWSFKLLVTATITQITFMLNIAVKHLFPAQKQFGIKKN